MLDTSHSEQVTVEAETVEQALAEISAQLGADAEIMRAQKVHRGGVGGFFAKEMVQLTARRWSDAAPAPLRPESRQDSRPSAQTESSPELPVRTGPKGSGIADVLERMAQSADAEDSDFRTVLQREMGATGPEAIVAALASDAAAAIADDAEAPTEIAEPEPTPDSTLVAPEELPEPIVVGPALRVVSEPAEIVADNRGEDDGIEPAEAAAEPAPEPERQIGPIIPFPDFDEPNLDEVAVAPDWWRSADTVDAPQGMGPIAWTTMALLRLGLPAPVLSAVANLEDGDDMGWIDAIATVVSPHCGPLPTGDVIVVGPHAERLAEPLGLPLIRSGDMAPYNGSFCAMIEDTPADREWLEFVRGGRGIHLVIGDEPWQDLLTDEPVAVSWVGENSVVDALYLAFTLGATLGFGTVDGFVSSMVRAQPTDVALAVRRIVGRR